MPEAQVAGIENPHKEVQVDHALEHDLTLKDVFRQHPKMIWWCFYWAMAAVGW